MQSPSRQVLLIMLVLAFAASASAMPLRAPVSVKLSVPAIVQLKSTSCGEAAIVMAYNYAHPETAVDEASVIAYAESAGLYTPAAPPFTSPASMLSLARNYAADAVSGNGKTQQDGLQLLTQHLQSGSPVIIDVTTRLDNLYSGAHFVVVTGLETRADNSNAIIYYNNPLTGHSESAEWNGNEGVWHAWHGNDDPGGSGWWLVIPRPTSFFLP